MHRRSKPATAVRTFKFLADRALEETWLPGEVVSVGDFRRPTVADGFEYECTDAGQTEFDEPEWPGAIGQTVVDGSAAWTCRDFTGAAADPISSISVDADSGINVDGTSNDASTISVTLSGGTIGDVYDVKVEWTTAAGERDSELLRITVVE